MAHPVDANRIGTSFGGLTGSDPWTANLPSGVVANDLLLIFYRGHGPATHVSSISGWTFLVDDNVVGDDPSNIAYKWASGSEGSTVTIDWTDVIKGATIAHRITGAINPSIQPPEVSSRATGSGANPDCPSITPTGGVKDYLIIAYSGMDGETQNYSVPTNYSNLALSNSGTSGSDGANVRLAAATRQVTAASEDPGAFTAAAPFSAWANWTVAIHPAQAGFAPQAMIL